MSMSSLSRSFDMFIISWWLIKHSLQIRAIDEGLTLETSAFLPFTVANLRFQLSC